MPHNPLALRKAPPLTAPVSWDTLSVPYPGALILEMWHPQKRLPLRAGHDVPMT